MMRQSREVYGQLFSAQAQLSRSLLAQRRDTRTERLSPVDSNSPCSTAASSRWQQAAKADDDDDDVADVGRLPDIVVPQHPSSDINERLWEKRNKKHQEALKQMDAELSDLSQVCETQVRAVSQQLLSSLQEADLRLDTLKVRMGQLEHATLQETRGLWEEVEAEVKLRKTRITEMNLKLAETERRRTDRIRAVLRKYCHLLEQISFLNPSDVHKLIDNEAMMLNQSLLANRRSGARLVLHLQEENLQKESTLRLHWGDCLRHWRAMRVNELVDQFRGLFSGDEDLRLVSLQETKQTQLDLEEQHCNIIGKLCSLVPPTCSITVVSDWFDQLTHVSQQIERFHADLLHQLRCYFDQTWQDRLAELEHRKEVLLALELSEEEVNDIVNSQLLPVIGGRQDEDEKRLAALDACSESVARHALSLSTSVFVVMRAAALLWETHCQRLERRDEKLQQNLDDLRCSQERHIQEQKVHVDILLEELRQGSSEDALRSSLDKIVDELQQIKSSCRHFVTDQWKLLDRHPSSCLEELLSYSSSLSFFYHLRNTYQPSPEDLQKLLPPSSPNPETREQAERAETPHDSQIWLTEVESCLQEICDFSSYVTFTSSNGVVYSAPAFRCPTLNLQCGTHLSLFPVDLLTDTLSRTRTLFLDHLEQHFHDVLTSAVSTITDRKETVHLELELQLRQLDPQHIRTHIYQPRLAELQLHRQHVDTHCKGVSDTLTSCWTELQEMQAFIRKKNEEFTVTLSNMTANIQTAGNSQRVEAVSATLQDCLDRHIKDIRCWQTDCRQTVGARLEEAKCKAAQFLRSFRLFSEGGAFAPQELEMFQRRVKEEIKRISMTEESIYSELEAFESRNLQQVKNVSTPIEEKLSFLNAEMKFMEKVQAKIGSTQVLIKAEAASSNQQQTVISRRLDDLRRMMEETQVSPDQVYLLLSSVSEELSRRCQYLDFDLESFTLSGYHEPRKQVQQSPPPGLQQPSREHMDFLNDPVVMVIKSLSRFGLGQDPAAESHPRGRTTAGLSPVQRPQRTRSVSALSGKRTSRLTRSIRTDIRNDRKFQIFGPEPDLSAQSFVSKVNSMLWKANDDLLQLAEDFYCRKRLGRLQLLPDSLDQWAESMQQRLLGYQEQAMRLLSTSRNEVEKQLSMFKNLLFSSPAVLISNHERQRGAGLTEEVASIRKKLEEALDVSEKERSVNMRQLRVSLREDELETLNSREELRQQQLHSAICSAHLQLQECVRDREEEFGTSLASLIEKLLHQMDTLLPTPAEAGAAATQQFSEDGAITMKTGAKTGSKPNIESSTGNLPSSVTTTTTESIPTAKCTPGHAAVMEKRDAAVKRFEQVLRSELSRSDRDKRRQLSEQQCWNTHWNQQIHTLKRTRTAI